MIKRADYANQACLWCAAVALPRTLHCGGGGAIWLSGVLTADGPKSEGLNVSKGLGASCVRQVHQLPG